MKFNFVLNEQLKLGPKYSEKCYISMRPIPVGFKREFNLFFRTFTDHRTGLSELNYSSEAIFCRSVCSFHYNSQIDSQTYHSESAAPFSVHSDTETLSTQRKERILQHNINLLMKIYNLIV